MSDVLVTPEGFERLEFELERLRTERETLVERLTRALEHGGALPENGDYLDARHEQELLERRIALLEERLHRAQVVEPEADGAVDVGERVTVLNLETGEARGFRVVGSGEHDPGAGDVSHVSPVGAALLGRRVGDVVEVEVPSGVLRLEVVEVDG